MIPRLRHDWRVWSCDASVVVTSPDALEPAVALTREIIDKVDEACSRFRSDSELARLGSDLADGATVSPMLADLVRGALVAAALTDGDVDPTLGNDLIGLGYDGDISKLEAYPIGSADALPISVAAPRAPGWRRITLDGSVLTVPAELLLDLGASAKAIAVDRAAHAVAESVGCGVLVSIGGDIATSGPHHASGWEIVVQDTSDDPSQQVSLGSGFAMATSSTQKRRWVTAGHQRHHILDPRFGLPAEVVWRSVTVAAETCLRANAFSTAAIVRGRRALTWLEQAGISARLVDTAGRVVTTGGWPVHLLEPERTGVSS